MPLGARGRWRSGAFRWMEDGKIEAYAVMGKTLNEVYVDPATGLVTKILSK